MDTRYLLPNRDYEVESAKADESGTQLQLEVVELLPNSPAVSKIFCETRIPEGDHS